MHKFATIDSLRLFDNTFTAPDAGYADAAAYYFGASALRVGAHIKTPTLIIAAKDDPLVPFESFEADELRNNPAVTLVGPDKGGHVAFISARSIGLDDLRPVAAGKLEGPRDSFWAEWQIVNFFLGLHHQR